MKKVIIYSTPTCVYCRMAKDFLTDKNIPFTEYDLSKDIAKKGRSDKEDRPDGRAGDRSGRGNDDRF